MAQLESNKRTHYKMAYELAKPQKIADMDLWHIKFAGSQKQQFLNYYSDKNNV